MLYIYIFQKPLVFVEVGLACVQLSRHIGLKVIGTAGSKAGMDLISNHGGNVVLNHKNEDYTKQIMVSDNNF